MQNHDQNKAEADRSSASPESLSNLYEALRFVLGILPKRVTEQISTESPESEARPPGRRLFPIKPLPEFFDYLRRHPGPYHPLIWMGGVFLCDFEFFETAPAEVARAVVAMGFAQAVTGTQHATTRGEEREARWARLVAEWGISPGETLIWFAARETFHDQAAVDNYYAMRFVFLNLAPPSSANLTGIAAVLHARHRPDLAERVMQIPSSLN